MTDILDKVGCYKFLAEPFLCDFSKHLFMGHLGNHMLNAADFHSNERGYGMSYLNPIHKTWVLSRLAIEMTEMPISYDEFNIETWVDGVMKFFTTRNFTVISSDSNKIYGYGKSTWAMIDTDTRQPVDILAVHDGLILNYIDKERQCPIAKSSRVKMSADAKLLRTIDTNYSDVDVNGHINSVKYIEHILDLWNLDWYLHNTIKRFEIAYVAECHCGDKLNFYSEHTSEDEYCIRITKSSKTIADEVEVVRSKVNFVKD